MKILKYFCLLLAFMLCNYAHAQFTGGSQDGYHKDIALNSHSIYHGGARDGAHFAKLESAANIFRGGSSDGFSNSTLANAKSIYFGGSKDGYATDSKILSYVWTGNIGTGWNVTGNWLNGIIPDINSNVVIPPGAINFPAINAGLMSIGQDPNSGLYLCKQILVRSGAEITFRVNAFLENYGDFEVRGSVYVLNSAIDAVQNLNGGLITVKNGGSLNLSQ